LLGIESMTVPYAAMLVAELINGTDPGTGNEPGLFTDPDDFGRFVAQHNWVDPVGMAFLAEQVDTAMNQAWKVDFERRSQGLPTG
jgi:hypothetical protein